MQDIFKRCDLLITQLQKFDASIVFLGSTINDKRLELFENEIGFELSLDFKYIIKKHNRIILHGTEIYGFDKHLRGCSLDEIYQYEHNEEVYNTMPSEFLPFSPDGRGNHYCLNLSKLINGICPVIFWQHDFVYKNLEEVEECNGDFISWIKEVLIEPMLEDYDYDGTEK
ncbi:MAG: SMI1/KNR4 family protein [Mucilaginibacter sp.]